jgi:hypothetical protein
MGATQADLSLGVGPEVAQPRLASEAHKLSSLELMTIPSANFFRYPITSLSSEEAK